MISVYLLLDHTGRWEGTCRLLRSGGAFLCLRGCLSAERLSSLPSSDTFRKHIRTFLQAFPS